MVLCSCCCCCCWLSFHLAIRTNYAWKLAGLGGPRVALITVGSWVLAENRYRRKRLHWTRTCEAIGEQRVFTSLSGQTGAALVLQFAVSLLDNSLADHLSKAWLCFCCFSCLWCHWCLWCLLCGRVCVVCWSERARTGTGLSCSSPPTTMAERGLMQRRRVCRTQTSQWNTEHGTDGAPPAPIGASCVHRRKSTTAERAPWPEM